MLQNNEAYNSENNDNNGGTVNNAVPPVNETFNYGGNNFFVDIGKKDIQKFAVITGLPLIIVLLISNYWSRVLFFFTGFFGVDNNNLVEILRTPVFASVLQIVLSMLMFLVPFYFAGRCTKTRISVLTSFEKPKSNNNFLYFVIGFSFCMFSNILVALAGDFFSRFGVDYSVNFGENDTSVYGIVLAVVSTAVVPALVEEFACRGIVLGSLLRFGEGFAILVSAILFGLMHGNFEQMPFAFLVGLALGFVRVKTKSIWICILIHFSNNLFSLASDYLSKILPSQINYVCYTSFVLIFLLAGIVSWLFLEKDKDIFSFDNGNYDIKRANKYKWYFSSPVIIVILILYLLKAFKYFV